MRSAFILLATLALTEAYGQSGYQEGFLLTESLDTVRGLIRFPGKVAAPSPCQFRTQKNAPEREVFPGTVHGFCMNNGSYYYSRLVGGTDDVFLEVLVKGYMNLFRFGDIFYVEKGDSVFFELSDEREVMRAEGQTQMNKTGNYSRMLTLLMSDCPEAGKSASTTPLKEKQLVRLVAQYNRCRGSESRLFRVKPRVK